MRSPSQELYRASIMLGHCSSARIGLLAACAVCASILGCTGSDTEQLPEAQGSNVLAPLTSLEPVSAADDPLVELRPEVVNCNPLTGWYAEDGYLEVSTAECNYAALAEPAQLDASAGERLLTQITHFDLTAPEPAEAYVALLIRDEVIWDRTIDIPGPANVIELSIELPSDVSRGDPVGVHIQNHGQNTWNVSPLRVQR